MFLVKEFDLYVIIYYKFKNHCCAHSSLYRHWPTEKFPGTRPGPSDSEHIKLVFNELSGKPRTIEHVLLSLIRLFVNFTFVYHVHYCMSLRTSSENGCFWVNYKNFDVLNIFKFDRRSQ